MRLGKQQKGYSRETRFIFWKWRMMKKTGYKWIVDYNLNARENNLLLGWPLTWFQLWSIRFALIWNIMPYILVGKNSFWDTFECAVCISSIRNGSFVSGTRSRTWMVARKCYPLVLNSCLMLTSCQFAFSASRRLFWSWMDANDW